MSHETASHARSVVLRILAAVCTALVLLLLAAYGVMWILVHGPSPTARRLFVLSVKETSAGGFLANLYLSEEEIASILGEGETKIEYEEMDLSLISLPVPDAPETTMLPETEDVPQTAVPEESADAELPAVTAPSETAASAPAEEDDGIEVIDITGSTYNGKLMIVSDPKRVFVGVPDSYGEGSYGLTVASMIRKYGCIAGTNAGGFYDPNGRGTGGIPEGIVIYEGKLLWGNPAAGYNLAGIDGDGILHVGVMTAQHALDIGVQYAASYGPALVINGQAAAGSYSLGGGLNPRTAIGMVEPLHYIMVVSDGRTEESIGLSLYELGELMQRLGCDCAYNLDGGGSSTMWFNGEVLNKPTTYGDVIAERPISDIIYIGYPDDQE